MQTQILPTQSIPAPSNPARTRFAAALIGIASMAAMIAIGHPYLAALALGAVVFFDVLAERHERRDLENAYLSAALSAADQQGSGRETP